MMKTSLKYTPTDEQLLLLKAGLKNPETAALSWESLCSNVNLQEIEYPSFTLLPLVYKNLKITNHDNLNTCKGVYRQTWYKNQLQLYKLKSILNSFQSASILTILLKGAAMIARYYKDPGLRVMGDIDILVPRSEALKAIDLLESLGWTVKVSDKEKKDLKKYINRTHAILLQNKEGDSIDLHWSVFAGYGFDQLLLGYQYKSLKAPLLHCETVNILSAEDQFLHTLFHGMHYSHQPTIRFIADATWILKSENNFDYDYLFSQIKHLKLQMLIYEGLKFLAKHSFIQIPSFYKRIILNYTPNAIEKKFYKHIILNKPNQFGYIVNRYWDCHARNSKSQNIITLLFTFPYYVKKVQELKYFYQVPLFVLKGVVLFMRRKIFSFI